MFATNLNAAARDGDLEKVKSLLQNNKAKVNDRATTVCISGFALIRSTALHQAAQHLHVDIVKFLIESGADINAKAGYENWTPLHAVAVNYFNVDEYIEDKGKRACEITEILIEKGADPTLKLTSGETAANWAIKSNTREILDFLKKSVKPSSKHNKRSSGRVDINLLDPDELQKVIRMLEDLIKSSINQNEDDNVIVTDKTNSNQGLTLTVESVGSAGYGKFTFSRDVARLLVKLNKEKIIATNENPAEEHTGYAGMCTYKPANYDILTVDLKKLQEYHAQQNFPKSSDDLPKQPEKKIEGQVKITTECNEIEHKNLRDDNEKLREEVQNLQVKLDTQEREAKETNNKLQGKLNAQKQEAKETNDKLQVKLNEQEQEAKTINDKYDNIKNTLFEKQKTKLKSELNKYLSHQCIFHRDRAIALKTEFNNAKSTGDLSRFISDQLSLYDKHKDTRSRRSFDSLDHDLRRKTKGPTWGYHGTLFRCKLYIDNLPKDFLFQSAAQNKPANF